MPKATAQAPRPRCRQISEPDLAAVADLLTKGFPHRGRAYWWDGLSVMAARRVVTGLPRFGYMIENDGVPVGAVLLIGSMARTGTADQLRCNVSSWYVEPEFQAYAPLLVSQATKNRQVTYFNISPAPGTIPIIEAQGFERYSNGRLLTLPMLTSWPLGDVRIERLTGKPDSVIGLEQWELACLQEQGARGCLSLVAHTPTGAVPFSFLKTSIKGLVPAAQLIYCRDVKDFVKLAGPLGRFLARAGRPVVIIDSDRPIPGLGGWHLPNRMPKYFKGPSQPRVGDLTDTEWTVFGL